MKIQNKKASHVGIVLSFVIFITFLVFILSVLQPALDTKTDNFEISKYIYNEVIKNVSGNVAIITFYLNSSKFPPGQDIIVVENPGINLTGQNFVIKNEEGKIIPSNYSYSEGLKINRTPSGLYEIYVSKNIKKQSLGSGNEHPIGNLNFRLGKNREKGFVIEEKIRKIIENETSFESFEDHVGLSIKTGFNLGLKLNDTSISTNQTIPNNLDVYVNEYPIQTINNISENKRGVLRIEL